MFSPSEPTQVARMVGDYQSSVRRSTSGTALPSTTKRSLATRLAFDDSCMEEPASAAKVSRLGADPFSSALGSTRFSSANSGAMVAAHEELEALKVQLKAARVEVAGCRAEAAAAGGRAAKAEMEMRREQVEMEAEKARLEREARDYKEKAETLKTKVKRLVERTKDEKEEDSRSRRQSIDRTQVLEGKVRRFREENTRLEEEMAAVRMELGTRPAVTQAEWRDQLTGFKRRIADLEQKEQQQEHEKERMQTKQEEAVAARKELVTVKEELGRSALRVGRLEGELRANQEAVMQRQVMRDKLEKFSDLERENTSLRNRNTLLVETAANTALLREQVDQQRAELEKLEGRVREVDRLRAELGVAREEVREWGQVVVSWLGQEDRERLGGREVGVAAAREVVARWQGREVALVGQVGDLQARERQAVARGEEQQGKVEVVEGELAKVRGEQEEQAKLLKRLQRKLLLVTKERDSYKGVLDSYEKEVTLSGQEMDKERFAAQEKTLEEYRAMVEMLEERGLKAGPNPEAEEKVRELEEANMALQGELERRDMRGDFDPSNTKVIHFTNNPMAQAVASREEEAAEGMAEREALRARVQLLEEGQTKDLTIMVGRKMEEGEGSEEVAKMKEELEKAELRKQRLMEAFKKTSHDFREVVYQLTGYRIDVLADHKYRLTPLYAEGQGDNLLFQKVAGGEVQMLESEYSLELGHLMELHLEQHNSIPMFLAGLIRELWRKQNPEAGEEEEEDEEDEDDEEGEGMEDGSGSEGEGGDGAGASDADSEVICIDD